MSDEDNLSIVSSTCNRCGTPYKSFSRKSVFCNVCLQTEAIEKQFENRNEKDLGTQFWEDYNRHVEVEEAWRRQMQERDIAEQQAKLYHALQREAGVSQADAYNYGRNYININLRNGNPANVQLYVVEDTALWANWNHPYHSADLQSFFRSGLLESLNGLGSGNKQTMLRSAELAGEQVAMGTLNPTFCLNTGLHVNGHEILSQTFQSNLQRKLNKRNAMLEFTWDKPFQSDEFNQAFARGVLNAQANLNSESTRKHRLKTEVKEIKNYGVTKFTKRLTWLILLALHIIFPFVAWHYAYEMTDGWWAFINCVVTVPVATYTLWKVWYGTWVDKNYEFLQF